MTLVDPSVDGAPITPTLPDGHPFRGIQSSIYWSMTPASGPPEKAYAVDVVRGNVEPQGKIRIRRFWCVRGGDLEPAEQPVTSPSA